MLTGNELFVTLKLITGEQLMAVLEAEDEKHIMVDFPIIMRGKIDVNLGREVMMAAPFSQFSDSTTFILEKSHVVFIKKLHPVFIKNYLEFVRSYEVTSFRGDEEEEEQEDLTIEDIKERLDALDALRGITPEEGEEIDDKVFIKGNDTKH